MNWWGAEWHKIVGALTGLMVLVVHGEEFLEKISKAIGFKKYIERRLGERRLTVINPFTIVEDINTAISTIEKLRGAVPEVQKLLADIKQAQADKQDATKLYADVEQVMTDVEEDLTLLASLFPEETAVVTKSAS